ncbi:hypothetical protein V6N12_031770 [Hibiscus sabdariffa]|uniref:Uncharacterized protein n=1 Tax=Hibiscus sabdariffa TaxID=183260 RepID=A0ABR2DVI4_9ROSI
MDYEDRYRVSQRPKYDCLLFGKLIYLGNENGGEGPTETIWLNLFADLDDTLYPLSSGLARECGNNIKGVVARVGAWLGAGAASGVATGLGALPAAVGWASTGADGPVS